MCGGFTCSKNALIALNILYVVSIDERVTVSIGLFVRVCVYIY